MMDQWMQFVSTIGLPGVLCFYVLSQLKKSIDANTKAITLLCAKFNISVDQPEQPTNPFEGAGKIQ